jgi:3'-5' exonuclease
VVLVAWDIETCPLPEEKFSGAQRHRLEQEMERHARLRPELGEAELSRMARSLHPHLGWICCISAVSGRLDGGPNTPKSWTAPDPAAERLLLRGFWGGIGRFPHGSTIWVTFNGKRFDVPFLMTRSAHHHIEPSRRDILSRNPYRNRPHIDLACIWPQPCSLEGMCDILGIATPKSSMDGSAVADAVMSGLVDAVARYCEQDVLATMRCLRAMPYVLDL